MDAACDETRCTDGSSRRRPARFAGCSDGPGWQPGRDRAAAAPLPACLTVRLRGGGWSGTAWRRAGSMPVVCQTTEDAHSERMWKGAEPRVAVIARSRRTTVCRICSGMRSSRRLWAPASPRAQHRTATSLVPTTPDETGHERHGDYFGDRPRPPPHFPALPLAPSSPKDYPEPFRTTRDGPGATTVAVRPAFPSLTGA